MALTERVRELNSIQVEGVFNALGRKKVIYSLGIHSSLYSGRVLPQLAHSKRVDSSVF